MKEDELREHVITPLLRAMGYRGVFEWHGGPGELGKDIVGWQLDEASGQRENLVVVAKATRLSTNNELYDVAAQVKQDFDSPYADPHTSESQSAHQVWIVSNKNLKKESRARIFATVSSQYRRWIICFDEAELWDLVRQHLLTTIHEPSRSIQQWLQSLESELPVSVIVTEGGHEIRLCNPGDESGRKHNRPMPLTFHYPGPERAMQHRIQLESKLARGESVEVSTKDVQFTIPDEVLRVFRELAGEEAVDANSITIVPPSELTLPVARVSIEVIGEDGENVVLPYIGLYAQRETDQDLLITNERQGYPILITQRLREPTRQVDLRFSDSGMPIAAPLLLKIHRILRMLKKPCTIRFRSFLTDEIISDGTTRGAPEINADDDSFRIASALGAIQQRTGMSIVIPPRAFTESEQYILGLILDVVESGTVEGTWGPESRLTVPPEALPALLQEFGGSADMGIAFDDFETVTLFGKRVPLGAVYRRLHSAKLQNESEVRAFLDSPH